MKKLLYFGCIGEKGHYLWVNEHDRCHNCSTLKALTGIEDVTDQFIHTIDGTFVPVVTDQGAYRVSIVPPFTIVAWHDYTVDQRSGSNSALLGVGFNSPDEIIDEANQQFPSVMKRQPVPLYPAVPV